MSRPHRRGSWTCCLPVAWIVAGVVIATGLFVRPAGAIEHDRPAGEPYQLAGRRIVFTTWYFVRPGAPEWIDAKTGGPFAPGVKVGPHDAKMLYHEAPLGVRLEAQPAQRLGPIIPRDKPWEQMGLSIGTIVRDGEKFRAWGNCQDAQGAGYTCYLESRDGRTWEKPPLGLVEYDGSRANNLIPYPVGTVFIDPIAPPQQRFKAVKHSHFDPEKLEEYKKRKPYSVMATEKGSGWFGDCIVGAVSPDGLNWTELPEPISIEPSDTQVVAGYDARLKKYVMFTRSHSVGPRAEGQPLPSRDIKGHNWLPRRAIGRSESEHFEQFPLSQVIVEAGSDMPPADTYYSNAYTTIPGAPDHYLMFPAIYHQLSDTTSIELQASYDGELWHRAPGSPVLKTTQFGQWDGGCVFTRPNMIELPDGSWAVPYTGYLYPHKYPRTAWAYDTGFAVWPKGRLMAIVADGQGQFSTPLFLPPGKTLKINAVTERAGSILVEVAGPDNQPLPGRSFADAQPIIGDQCLTTVTWKNEANDLGVEPGKPIMLRFRLDKARIYGLEFE
ncbi:hypothetical protein [Fontivita pretiosa]|uniref:hypothetical protein n=1 Tax=Fontivita pretiosa TaxID=2989684 RepID=UPI003D17FF14